ncbi:MAG: hypothetical protein AAGJ40_22035 [Planctomycetota bacterium]
MVSKGAGKSGFFVNIVGVVGVKSSGVDPKDGTPWFSVAVDYTGGSQRFYCDSAAEFNAFPDEGEEVEVDAKLRVGKEGKFRLSQVEVSPPAAATPRVARTAA